jgi:hypothetical protein
MRDFRRGIGAFDRGDCDEAVSLLDAHMRRHPSDHRARLWLARAQAEAGHVDESLSLLREAGAHRRRSAVPHAFAALILLDAQRFEEAAAEADIGAGLGDGYLSASISLLARGWQGAAPTSGMVRLLMSANSDLRGRALHLAETRVATLPDVVLRDVMDEVGIGWPHHRMPPAWLFKRQPERAAWREMAMGKTDDAFLRCAAWAEDPTPAGRAPTMIASAMAAGHWDAALAWALLIPHYRAFHDGTPPRRTLNHFQVVLFRGFCTLQGGDADGSRVDLERAAQLDQTSYLPRYLKGRAMVRAGRWTEARREYVAACERLNPSLAVVQWKTLLRNP